MQIHFMLSIFCLYISNISIYSDRSWSAYMTKVNIIGNNALSFNVPFLCNMQTETLLSVAELLLPAFLVIGHAGRQSPATSGGLYFACLCQSMCIVATAMQAYLDLTGACSWEFPLTRKLAPLFIHVTEMTWELIFFKYIGETKADKCAHPCNDECMYNHFWIVSCQ